MKGTFVRRMLFGALAVGAAVVAAVCGVGSGLAGAAGEPAAAVSPHVVIVGLSGLRWADVSPAVTPALWTVAKAGAVGSLVDFAVGPDTCPADAWLTLNGGDRAQVPHGSGGPCPALPPVRSGPGGAGVPGPARVAAMPSLVGYDRTLKYGPRWGLLASAAGPGSCATAAGPGAALALAGPGGVVGSYLPGVSGLSRAVLARCPLTVADLGSLPAGPGGGRAAALRHADAALAALTARLPAGTTLLVAGLGAAALPPHLQVVLVRGPGYRAGVLASASTRQPGLVVLTDLTVAVLGWRGQPRPGGLPGAPVTAAARGPLDATVRGLAGQDSAAQVWRSTHTVFFWAYALAGLAVFAGVGLVFRGAGPGRRARRARWWRAAGVIAGAVPAGSFLANVVPWWLLGHPAVWQYALTAGCTALISGLALAGPWRRDPFGPPGAVALSTVLIVGLDVMTGSRLQLGAPFGLSVLEAGRFYGIGGEAVGLYAVCTILAVAWAGHTLRPRGRAVAAASAVAAFAVIACGWPQFGAKVGGTIAIVPCVLLLLMAIAGTRITVRRVTVVLGSGVALFAVFALISYLIPATGQSDIGSFAGNLFHGQSGGLLMRKLTSMLGSLAVNTYSPLVPLVVILVGLMLLRPSWFAVKALPRGYAAEPLLAMTLAMMWLVCVLGWFADDSGIIVPATALPLALPLGFALLAGVPLDGDGAAERRPVVPRASIAGRIG